MKQDHFWWNLKGAKGFIENVVMDLVERKNVLIETPILFPESFQDALHDAIEEAWPLQRTEIDLSAENDPFSPEEIIDRTFSRDQASTLPNLKDVLERLLDGDYGNHVVEIRGMTEARWEKWMRFFKQYQPYCHGDHRKKYPRFWTVCDGFFQVGHIWKDSCISIRRWKNRIGRFEMYCYVGKLLEETVSGSIDDSRIAQELRHEIITELAGTDPEIADLLVTVSFREILEPLPLLLHYATKFPWSNLSEETDSEMRWRLGAMDYRRDEVYHHSALYAMHSKIHEIKRRIWRAELRVLMPVLENFRSKLQDNYYHELRNVPREKEIEDMEIGDIADALYGRFPPLLWQEIRHKRKIRNDLAHFRPAEWEYLEAEFGVINCGS